MRRIAMTYQKTYPWDASARILTAQPIGDVPAAGIAVAGDLATMIRGAMRLPAQYQNGLTIVYGAAYNMRMDEIRHAAKLKGFRDKAA
jgi:hypothetical protein